MSSVTAGFVFTSSTPITAANLNLLGNPIVTPSANEIVPSMISSSGIGYATGAGGTVTQTTNKATTVALNAACGAITMNNAALTSATSVSFTVTNTLVASTDLPLAIHSSGGTAGVYRVDVNSVSTSSYKIMVTNVGASSLSEAIVLTTFLLKGVTS